MLASNRVIWSRLCATIGIPKHTGSAHFNLGGMAPPVTSCLRCWKPCEKEFRLNGVLSGPFLIISGNIRPVKYGCLYALSSSTLTPIDTEAFLDALGECVRESLAQGNEAVLPGIGKLTVKERPARTGRNPATGEPIQIAARKAPAFSTTKALKNAVDRG